MDENGKYDILVNAEIIFPHHTLNSTPYLPYDNDWAFADVVVVNDSHIVTSNITVTHFII